MPEPLIVLDANFHEADYLLAEVCICLYQVVPPHNARFSGYGSVSFDARRSAAPRVIDVGQGNKNFPDFLVFDNRRLLSFLLSNYSVDSGYVGLWFGKVQAVGDDVVFLDRRHDYASLFVGEINGIIIPQNDK